jgi:hypothetical protein
MSEEPRRKFHAMMWILSVLVAVPVLYFLSFPFVSAFNLAAAIPTYNALWTWAYYHTPLQAMQRSYFGWCYGFLGMRVSGE